MSELKNVFIAALVTLGFAFVLFALPFILIVFVTIAAARH